MAKKKKSNKKEIVDVTKKDQCYDTGFEDGFLAHKEKSEKEIQKIKKETKNKLSLKYSEGFKQGQEKGLDDGKRIGSANATTNEQRRISLKLNAMTLRQRLSFAYNPGSLKL